MVEISYLSKEQIPSFKDGAKISTAIIYDAADTDTFKHSGSFKVASDLYNNSTTHVNLYRIISAIENNISEFDKGMVADIMEAVAQLDPHIYRDIMVILIHLLKAKDIEEQKIFLNSIWSISDNETRSNDILDPEANNDSEDTDLSSINEDKNDIEYASETEIVE